MTNEELMVNLQNIVLDLDNTLIFAEALTEFPFKQPGIKDKAIKFTIHDMDNYYIVFERPQLQSFLDYIFENFNVSIFTAASKDYALFIIKNIILTKESRKLDYIFWSYHCDLSQKIYKSTKDLRLLWEHFKIPGYAKNNTVIIDDLDEVYESQPDNCIPIRFFNMLEKNSEHDNELEKVLDIIEPPI
jgi:TFIIF-interacting CTD phosphatase-like protein